ncbi:hypothetical protein COLO4_09702 [Corchorus olitorius]|uniref:Glycosyltransferase 61 catalytic domain-containing protein n=1 Tax=Corchorus olitorius TaxID=93759 RepID=A0A1R3KBD9_9ROSI|nr:hypothetical protein COLO4_09702 [Corchorus olitorius]
MLLNHACATLAISFVLIVLLYAAFFPSKYTPFQSWNNQSANSRSNTSIDVVDSQYFLLRRLVRGDDRVQLESNGFSCHTDVHSDVCLANKPVRIKNKGLKVHVPSDDQLQANKRLVRPYARQEDETAMKLVTPVEIIHGNYTNDLPACNFTHNVTALVFSSRGFTGNVFHEFNEIVIPLFITSRHFKSQLQFVITDFQLWVVQKYNKILSHLSNYEIINPEAADSSVHCFPGAVIGLKFHDNLALNMTDIPGGYSMFDFRHFLRQAYNLKVKHVSEINHQKPVLMLISRRNSRRFLNEDEMVEMMEELGFQVTRAEPGRMSNLDKFAEVVNSCSVMVGAHGAGLTNEIFLPNGAVVVQVVPLENEWVATNYFGQPSKEMGLHYLEYKIEPEESSLIDTYSRDHPVFTNPQSIISKGYYEFRSIYVDGQDIRINLEKFRKTLIEAKQLIENSTPFNR